MIRINFSLDLMREKVNTEESYEKSEDKVIMETRKREINPFHNINMVNEMTEHENNSLNSLNIKENKPMDINDIVSQAKITQDGSEFRFLIDKLYNVIKEKDALINKLTVTRKSPN